MAPQFHAAIQSFAASSTTFKLIRSFSPNAPAGALHILDSSFNPPTRAHLSLARTAAPGARILLLLATKNADKPAAPASFEDRLEMMHRLAGALQTRNIDIAITKHSLFVAKAADIAREYRGASQTYPMGFDTLVRVLDAKYYTGPEGMHVLDDFFGGANRVLCQLRGEGLDAQREYFENLRRGDVAGCRREWADKIDVVEAGPDISSSAARETVAKGNSAALEEMLTAEVVEWVKSRGLYVKDEY